MSKEVEWGVIHGEGTIECECTDTLVSVKYYN